MPSQLFTNGAIAFVACKPFTYRGTEYEIGDDFPQEEANNIETLVRARFVIPVVEDVADKPRHWHGHIRTREQAYEYLFRERTQLRMPDEPDSDEVVNLEVLTHPETTPEPTQDDEPGAGEDQAPEPEDELAPEPPESLEETYDPAEHNVDAVLEYLREHPEQRDEVLAMEEAGRGRKGILGD
jgi:hypothetical protein